MAALRGARAVQTASSCYPAESFSHARNRLRLYLTLALLDPGRPFPLSRPAFVRRTPMLRKITIASGMALLFCCASLAIAQTASRHLTFRYEFTVRNTD